MFFLLALVLLVHGGAGSDSHGTAREFFSRHGRPETHSNNWAVLVDTSRFWSNYRHAANVLSMYHLVKKLGIPDSNIILMLGDDIPCNIRNIYPATLFNNQDHAVNLYGDHVHVDYRGYDVTVENFLRLLTGRHDPNLPPNKRLASDAESNILVYMSGHGGDRFLKFQDATEVTAQDVQDSLWQMWTGRRYHSLLLIVETCQAATLVSDLSVPGVVAIGSSRKGENAYSHHRDGKVGVHVIDRFTYYTLDKLDRVPPSSTLSLQKLFDSYDPHLLSSHVQYISTHPKPLNRLKVMDFFSSRSRLLVLPQPAADLPPFEANKSAAGVPSTPAAFPADKGVLAAAADFITVHRERLTVQLVVALVCLFAMAMLL